MCHPKLDKYFLVHFFINLLTHYRREEQLNAESMELSDEQKDSLLKTMYFTENMKNAFTNQSKLDKCYTKESSISSIEGKLEVLVNLNN